MTRQFMAGSATVLSVALASTVDAAQVVGAAVVVPNDNTIITLEYVSAEAAYTGELSFLGSGDVAAVTNPATDSALSGLGQQTFVNHTLAAAAIVLPGVYNEGDVLHFAYRVFDPVEAVDLLRTDDVDSAQQFAWDAESGTLYVEDLRHFDFDYNDLIVHVSFSSGVPAPASAPALLVAGLPLFRRRRRLA